MKKQKGVLNGTPLPSIWYPLEGPGMSMFLLKNDILGHFSSEEMGWQKKKHPIIIIIIIIIMNKKKLSQVSFYCPSFWREKMKRNTICKKNDDFCPVGVEGFKHFGEGQKHGKDF